MRYTINQLAKLSGVSTRTLRFYDEIGLLKPAYYGENNYRYYQQEQLILLQQILFYRELDMSLNDIKNIIYANSFNIIQALQAHKTVLAQNLTRQTILIQTIDKTIAHLKGEQVMKLEEIFHGFSPEKQQLYENFLVDSGVDSTIIKQCKEKIKHWPKEAWLANKQEGDRIHTELVAAINQGFEPSAPAVQSLIQRHYQLTKSFWIPTRETYIGLSQLYASHPDFVKFYEAIHPELLPFLMAAMKIFAETQLT